MGDTKFKDSVYRFIDPVRYFKENDPYYFEVDNIPLKQLQENILWLKDQLGAVALSGVKREDLDELRPYVDGTNNKVKVRPGRYMARVNDAYSIPDKLQLMEVMLGTELGELDHWRAYSESVNSIVKTTLAKFKTKLATNATHMTGLAERAFTHPIYDAYFAAWDKVLSPTVQDTNNSLKGLQKPPFPLSEVLLWASTQATSRFTYVTKAYDITDRSQGFLPLAIAENHLIKRWRGIFRTAVVDIPNELSVDIPKFDDADFFYNDENGNRVALSADLRIDLLFVYTKTIDTSSATIGKYVNGQPTSISTPTLGIVKGAGLGLDFKNLPNLGNDYTPKAGIASDGTPIILANPSDELDTAAGFTALNVHGSFPSPEDLLNKAPTIAEHLETDNLMLVGQSILPLAYIVVRKSASSNANGQHVIAEADVIDIRPFLRTAELTYNERAGIAAAMPALSLANPAVGKAHMDQELWRLHSDYTGKIKSVENKINQNRDVYPRVVGAGYVFGGANFGVESTLMDFLRQTLNISDNERLKQEVINRYALPSDVIIPDYPDWDQSRWVKEGSHASRGFAPNDYINTVITDNEQVTYGCWDTQALTHRVKGFGTENIIGKDGHTAIHFVKKTINIDRSKTKWMKDYYVDVQYWNCFPLSSRAGGFEQDTMAAAAGIWVEKNPNSFSIYIAWAANDQSPFSNRGSEKQIIPGGSYGANFPANQRDGHWFAGFGVMTKDIYGSNPANNTNYTGEPAIGVSIYPTIMFQIVGIPSSFSGFYTKLGGSNPLMVLG